MIQNISIKIAHQMETKKLSQKPLRVQIIQKIIDTQVNLHEIRVHRSIFITQCAWHDWDHGNLVDVDINQPIKLENEQVNFNG